MGITITDLMVAEGPSLYYEEGFRNLIESHLTFLREHPQTSPLTQKPHSGYKYENDFYGYLQDHNVPSHLHWIILRINGMTSPMEFGGEEEFIWIPDNAIIQQLATTYASQRKQKNRGG